MNNLFTYLSYILSRKLLIMSSSVFFLQTLFPHYSLKSFTFPYTCKYKASSWSVFMIRLPMVLIPFGIHTKRCNIYICCCLVIQSCVTLCNPMDCPTPGFSVLNHLPKFSQTHVHWVDDAIQPFHPLSPPSPSALNIPQHQCLFQWVSSSHRLQCTGASSSALVLPMNIQGWFPLGLTGLTSSLSKGLSRVFSNTTVHKHQLLVLSFGFFMVQLSHPYMTTGKTMALTVQIFVSKVMFLLWICCLGLS